MTQYNGWTNYETWRVNLEMVDGMTLADFGFSGEDLDPDSLMDCDKVGQALEMYVCDMVEQESKGFVRELALSFLARVDWSEIAEHLVKDFHADAEYMSEVREELA